MISEKKQLRYRQMLPKERSLQISTHNKTNQTDTCVPKTVTLNLIGFAPG